MQVEQHSLPQDKQEEQIYSQQKKILYIPSYIFAELTNSKLSAKEIYSLVRQIVNEDYKEAFKYMAVSTVAFIYKLNKTMESIFNVYVVENKLKDTPDIKNDSGVCREFLYSTYEAQKYFDLILLDSGDMLATVEEGIANYLSIKEQNFLDFCSSVIREFDKISYVPQSHLLWYVLAKTSPELTKLRLLAIKTSLA
jgi:hypothetical protein